MEKILLQIIVICFSSTGVFILLAGCISFIRYVNGLEPTISTIIYTGIIVIVVVAVAANLSYMGIPHVIIYSTIITFIGYGNEALKLIRLK